LRAADQTSWVAIYAAVVGTVGVVVAAISLSWQIWRHRREGRTDVRVEAVYDAVPETGDAVEAEVDMIRYSGRRVPGFFITVFNAGDRTEYVQQIGMGSHPGAERPTTLVWFPEEGHALPARNSITRPLPLYRLAPEGGSVAFCARLASGEKYWSGYVEIPRRD